MADLMCECKSPAHPWEPGESCPPERVVNGGRELIARAIVALEKLHEDPQATYEDMARAVLSLTSDEAEWWASERLDLQAECREANASEAAAIDRAREVQGEALDRLAKIRDCLPTRDQLYALTQAAEVATKVRLLVEDALDPIDDYSLDAASQPQRERPPNVLSQEEARLVIQSVLPAMEGSLAARLSDRLSDFAFPDDEPYKPHPATERGGTYLPPDARPDSTGLPEFGELPQPDRLDTLLAGLKAEVERLRGTQMEALSGTTAESARTFKARQAQYGIAKNTADRLEHLIEQAGGEQ